MFVCQISVSSTKDRQKKSKWERFVLTHDFRTFRPGPLALVAFVSVVRQAAMAEAVHLIATLKQRQNGACIPSEDKALMTSVSKCALFGKVSNKTSCDT